MDNTHSITKKQQLLIVIVDHRLRDVLEDTLEELACSGYFCLTAKDATRPSLFKSLGLEDDARLYYMIPLPALRIDAYAEALQKAFNLHPPKRGISFRHPLDFLLHQKETAAPEKLEELMTELSKEKPEATMYKKISVITDLGKAEEAMRIAKDAGATGGTILHGHGSVGEQAGKLFGIRIVPEKELLLIIAPAQKTPAIVKAVAEKMALDKPGNGILYVETIHDATGLVK